MENADHTSLNVSWDLFCEFRKADCQVFCLTQPSECTRCETAAGLHTTFPGGHRSSVNIKSSLCSPEHGTAVIHMKASNTISSLSGCLRCPCKAADVAQIHLCTRQDPVRASVSKQIISRPAGISMVSHWCPKPAMESVAECLG